MSIFQKNHIEAAQKTLRNIAGSTQTHWYNLFGPQSLEKDLGYESKRFSLLASWQRQLGDRLRHDGRATQIFPQDLHKSTVAGVLGLTLHRALGEVWESADLLELIELAKQEHLQ